jgi:siroheme synthase
VGVSLTQRGVARSVTFATPRVAPGAPENSWADAVARTDTAAIYMGAGEAAAVAEALRARGKPGNLPVVAIENASLPNARRWTTTLAGLPRLADESFEGPVMLLLGEVFAAAVVREQFLAASRTYLLQSAR